MPDLHFLIDSFKIFGIEIQNWVVIAVVAVALAVLLSLRKSSRSNDS
jgi:hypothetical protein